MQQTSSNWQALYGGSKTGDSVMDYSTAQETKALYESPAVKRISAYCRLTHSE